MSLMQEYGNKRAIRFSGRSAMLGYSIAPEDQLFNGLTTLIKLDVNGRENSDELKNNLIALQKIKEPKWRITQGAIGSIYYELVYKSTDPGEKLRLTKERLDFLQSADSLSISILYSVPELLKKNEDAYAHNMMSSYLKRCEVYIENLPSNSLDRLNAEGILRGLQMASRDTGSHGSFLCSLEH